MKTNKEKNGVFSEIIVNGIWSEVKHSLNCQCPLCLIPDIDTIQNEIVSEDTVYILDKISLQNNHWYVEVIVMHLDFNKNESYLSIELSEWQRMKSVMGFDTWLTKRLILNNENS